MHPVLFKIGPLTIYSYGVMVAVAFLTAALLMRSRACNFGIRPAVVLDLITWIFISGIAGARLMYILVNPDIFIADPLEMVMLHHGGLVFFGGLLGGLLGSMLFVRKRGLSFPNIADLMAPYVALGQAIGKIGCFLNGCCYGRPTNLPFGIIFPGLPGPRHPAQIYESLCYLALFVFLIFLQRRRQFFGGVFLLYVMLYSTARFFIEYARGDTSTLLPHLTIFQAISLIVFAGSMALYIAGWRRVKKKI